MVPTMSGLQPETVSRILDDEEYIRQRIAPRPGDPLHLHFSDLLICLSQNAATDEAIDLLDFGSGGSPYRSLFPNARYRRADVRGTPGVDFEIQSDGRTNAPSGGFDLVLSTQVLEHVPDAARYLRNCYDLIRPGGKLVLTTHGMFEDHGCPNDFRRWTADGLAMDIASAGFEVQVARKLTTEGRALAFLLRTKLQSLAAHEKDWYGLVFRALHRMLGLMSRSFDTWCDRRLSGFRSVDAKEAGHTIYVALLVTARKPSPL